MSDGVIKMLKNMIKKFLPTPEWQIRNAARDTYVANTLHTFGDERRVVIRARFPQMNEMFVEEYIRAELEREFWRMISAVEQSGLKITRG